ncbi:nucleotidyltransferase domain-containing protein [Candidatus Woesearchaeota archaeon]|nr:nucleotidyltransferase domain-containing protein [Candidatus Woesearchaeota archaeon]
MDNLILYFFKEPGRSFHVRELAKICKKSPTTISKHLLTLQKKGLLLSSKKLNHLLFTANTGKPAFRDMKIATNLQMLRSSGLLDAITQEYNHPEAIILFGSYRKGEDTAGSDIDIAIITPLKKEINLSTFEKKLGRPIQLFCRSRSDIEDMKKKNKELLNNWINGIVVEGFWEAF